MRSEPPPGFLKREDNLFTRTGRRVGNFWRQWSTGRSAQILGCVILLLVSCFLVSTPVFSRPEFMILDLFFKIRPALPLSSDIVYIEIAEDSLRSLGRWPWSRNHHAVLTHILSEWKARAIVFDVLFNEAGNPLEDGAFEEALQKAPSVYFPAALEEHQGAKIWIRPLPRFIQYAKGIGHINMVPDSDGIIRRIQPYLTGPDETYPHLAVKVASDFGGELAQGAAAELLIHWAGRWRDTFAHYSYVDILRSYEDAQKGLRPAVSPDKLQGKICLVGLTATGLADIKANPLESTYPALGVNANVIDNILTGRFLKSAGRAGNQLVLITIGLLAAAAVLWLRPVISFLACLLLASGWFAVSFLLFWKAGIWVYVFHPAVLIFCFWIFSAIFLHVVGEKERSALFQLAARDGLTGLYVIRHFRVILNRTVREAQRSHRPLSLILTDIDNFKKINDTYGHPAGDEVLRQVAHAIQSVIRQERPRESQDLTARYGGEEFIVMLRNATLANVAFSVAERIRKSVEGLEILWEGKKLPVTISLGVSTLHPGEYVPDLLVQRADEALYCAKREGKNRVSLER